MININAVYNESNGFYLLEYWWSNYITAGLDLIQLQRSFERYMRCEVNLETLRDFLYIKNIEI